MEIVVEFDDGSTLTMEAGEFAEDLGLAEDPEDFEVLAEAILTKVEGIAAVTSPGQSNYREGWDSISSEDFEQAVNDLEV